MQLQCLSPSPPYIWALLKRQEEGEDGHLAIDHSPKCNEAKISTIQDGPAFPDVEHEGAAEHIDDDEKEAKVKWHRLTAALGRLEEASRDRVRGVGAVVV